MENRLLTIAVEHRSTLLASILLQALQSYAGMVTMERVVSRKEELSSRIARGFMEMVSFRIQRQFAAGIERVDSLSKDVAMSEGRIGLVNELFFTGFALLVFMVEVTVIVRQTTRNWRFATMCRLGERNPCICIRRRFVMRILLGLFKPDEGTVAIGEQDLSLTDLGTYYEAISSVSQDAPVFEGTLRENLVERRVVPEDDVWAALERTRLRSHIEKLGLGLGTRTGERGVSLSAGERQRIALARVLLSPAPLVCLDEPTSAPDSETEAAVMKGFFASMGNRTVVMVAHRLQPVRLCDDIVVIEHGKVVQECCFSDLAGSSGRFRELWDEQTRF
jgi:ABC-type lipoprotein export system ATPase subunit